MHEFSAVQHVMDELEKNPRDIRIQLGCMRAGKEVFLNTLKEMRYGTPLKKLKIDVEEIKAKGKCTCGFEGNIEVPGHVHFLRCPECGKTCETVQGNELIIKEPEKREDY
ncbi:MAG: hydrogenase/urease maturation nickel metallochaperone HypA [archaeon]|nr:hydrogenase/urease maturation nickel metallochaperone HypA [archaeon]